MSNLFLQEIEATVLYFDMKAFSVLSAQLGPVDLALALTRYYEYTSELIEQNGGRLIKFVGDGVLGVFGGAGEKDHRGEGCSAVEQALRGKTAWLADNAGRNLPVMDFTAGLASGQVLIGDIGTARRKMFDVLGEPVTVSIRLNQLASVRGVSHLITHETYEPVRDRFRFVELEPAEIGRRLRRLYRLGLEAEEPSAQ
jgi:adenylate cyclase